MTSEDSIGLDCAGIGARDNYYRLPLLLASLAPSGPVPWEIIETLNSLPDLSSVCNDTYDPNKDDLAWFDLAGLLRAAGFDSLLDSEECFETNRLYTVSPIDPVSDLAVADLSMYNWQEHYDFSQDYYRPGSGGPDTSAVRVFNVTTGLVAGTGVSVNKFDHVSGKTYYFECSQPGEDGILLESGEVQGLWAEVQVPPYTGDLLGYDYPASPEGRVTKLYAEGANDKPLYVLDTVPDVGSGLSTGHVIVDGVESTTVVPVLVPIIYHRFAPPS